MRKFKLLVASVFMQVLFALGLGILISKSLAGNSTGWGDLIGFLMGLILGAWLGATIFLVIIAIKSKIRKRIYIPIALSILPLEMLTIFISSMISSITIILPILVVTLNSIPVILISRKSDNLKAADGG